MASKGGADYLPPIVTRLEADLTGLRAGYAEAERLQKRFEGSTESLGDEFKQTGEEATKAGKKVSDFERLVGDRMRESENSAKAVRREYSRLERHILDVRKRLAKGDGDSDPGLFKDLDLSLKDLGKLRKIGTDMGLDLGKTFSQGFSSVISAAGPYGIAGAIATAITAAIVLAPAIGAAIAGALTIGLGAGVIGLGAMILGDDKQIVKRAEKLATTTSKVFERSAQPLKKPFLEALGTIEAEFKKMEPDLTKMFGAAAPLVAPLTEGFMGLLANMLPGITSALQGAKPLFDSLAKTLPLIGTALGTFFDTLANTPGVAVFMEDMIKATAGVIVALGYVISWLASFYTAVRETVGGVLDWFGKLPGRIKKFFSGVGDWLKSAGTNLMAGFINGVKTKFESVKTTLSGMVNGIKNIFKVGFKFGSPSRVMMDMGRDTVEGYRIGIVRAAPRMMATWAGLLKPGGAPRGSYLSGVGMSSTAGSAGLAGGGSGQVIIHNVLKLDTRTVLDAMTPTAQRYRRRTGVTGLS